jgi:hypothetical protein
LNGRTTRLTTQQLPSGKRNSFVGGGFLGRCHGQDVTLVSDSAEYYEEAGLLYLIGNVHYKEPRVKIDAAHMTYWTADGHLRAEGSVYAVMKSGATMRGPVADYYRVVPKVRTQSMMVATNRPRLTIIQRDSITGKVSDTIHVVADRITSLADSLTYAGGDVHITRPQLIATGDSAFLNNGTGRAQLLGKPVVEARRSRPFTLTGGVIDIFSTNRQVSRVVATPYGHATSQDLQLYADSIDLRVKGNVLQRAIAWGKGVAHAMSSDRDITADSIDALLPDQRLHEIHAVRNAYATSIPDTITIIALERDWMRGDTIVAMFDTVARGDTTHTPPIRTLVANNRAKAYYHVKNEHDKHRPGVNYVRGRVIDIAFHDAAVQTVTVLDRASGVYIEAADSVPSSSKRPAAPQGIRNPRRRR